MSTITDLFAKWPKSVPLATVLHIGAGAGEVLGSYVSLAPRRAILVEGDPDMVADLRERAVACPWAEVRGNVLSPRAGTTLWHRFNLGAMNGVLEPSGLKGYYPRLRLLSSLPLPCIDLTQLLQSLALSSETGRSHLLVLDLPGLEDALLEGVAPELLRQFDWILLRGSQHVLHEGGREAQQAVKRLQGLGFGINAAEAEDEPLWPVTLLRFDRARFERDQLEQRLGRAEALLKERDQALAGASQKLQQFGEQQQAAERQATDQARRLDQISKERDEHAKLAAERQTQLEQLAEVKNTAEKAAAERLARLEQISKERDEHAKLAAERQTQLEQLAEVKNTVEKAAAERLARIERISKERDEHAKLAAERQTQLEQLAEVKNTAEKAAAERLARLEQISKERDLHAKTSAERQAQIEALNKQLAQLNSEKALLQKDKTSLAAARDEQQKLAADRLKRQTQLEQELTGISARYGLLQEELIKAEAQIELIADLLLREPRT
jgi:hypothetical protein